MFKKVEKESAKAENISNIGEKRIKECVSNDDLLSEVRFLRDDLIRIERKIDSIKNKSKIKNVWENDERIL